MTDMIPLNASKSLPSHAVKDRSHFDVSQLSIVHARQVSIQDASLNLELLNGALKGHDFITTWF